MEFHDSSVEPSSEIQPQLERQSFVAENFVVEEEVVPVGAVEEDMEIVVVVDFRTECRLLVENLLELKLFEFLMKLDVLSDLAYLKYPQIMSCISAIWHCSQLLVPVGLLRPSVLGRQPIPLLSKGR